MRLVSLLLHTVFLGLALELHRAGGACRGKGHRRSCLSIHTERLHSRQNEDISSSYMHMSQLKKSEVNFVFHSKWAKAASVSLLPHD